jgi:hypothetical protein
MMVPRALAAAVAAVLVLALLPTPAWGFFPSAPTAQATLATLTVTEPSVTVIPGASGAAHAGVSGETVGAGDRILTANPGGAVITFADGSEVELAPGTEVRLDAVGQTAGGGSLVAIAQASGTTVSRVTDLGANGSYQLETPNATAFVRGTLFQTDVLRDPATRRVLEEKFTDEEGVLDILFGNKKVTLQPGEFLRIVPGPGGSVMGVAGDPTATEGQNPPPRPTTNAPVFLTVSGPDAGGIMRYEVHFRDPATEARRDVFQYAWSLDVGGSECVQFAGMFQAGPMPWQAYWGHPPCTHGPNDRVQVRITLGQEATTRVITISGHPGIAGDYGP